MWLDHNLTRYSRARIATTATTPSHEAASMASPQHLLG